MIGEDALIRRASAGDTDAFADLLAPRVDRLLRSATIKADGTGLGLATAIGISGGHAELRPIP